MNSNYKDMNEALTLMEIKIKNALEFEIKHSRHTLKNIEGNVLPVNVYDYVGLMMINDKLTFIDKDGQHYEIYAECSLEDLMDILINIPEKKDVTLKSETKTVTIIDAHDFNRFVEEIYGGDFEFEAIQEANNATYEFDTREGAHNFGEFEKIREGDYPMYCTHHLFRVLYLDGYLENGDYLIDNRH